MSFKPFSQSFGQPQRDTELSLDLLKLNHSTALQQFVREVGGGVFAEGLVSLVSTREQVTTLGGWEHWLPSHIRLFGCSAFGFLMLTGGDDLWLVDTQYGQVVESDFSLPEFMNELANAEAREEVLRAQLFHSWNQMAGPLPPSSVLCPTPAIPLGGTWAATTLATMTLPVYLSFTGQIFGPDGGMPAEVLRLGE